MSTDSTMPSSSSVRTEKTPVCSNVCQSDGVHPPSSRSSGNADASTSRTPCCSSTWSAVGRKCIYFCLGSPRMRSLMMLRWICEVPAAIV